MHSLQQHLIFICFQTAFCVLLTGIGGERVLTIPPEYCTVQFVLQSSGVLFHKPSL